MVARTANPLPLSPRQRRLRYLGRGLLPAALLALVILGLAGADRLGWFGRRAGGDWQRYHQKSFRVVRVVDGDTFDIDEPDGKYSHTRIRMLGLDTPETVKPNTPVQHYGPEASDHLKELLKGRSVTVELDDAATRDKYQRLLAYALLAGTNVNLAMVEEGYGYADPRFPHRLKGQFAKAQTGAIKARRGLWQGVTQNDLPDYYRNGEHTLPRGAVRVVSTQAAISLKRQAANNANIANNPIAGWEIGLWPIPATLRPQFYTDATALLPIQLAAK